MTLGRILFIVTPARAGAQSHEGHRLQPWVPAFAG